MRIAGHVGVGVGRLIKKCASILTSTRRVARAPVSTPRLPTFRVVRCLLWKGLSPKIVEPYPYPVSHKGEYHFRSGSTKQELKGAALDKFLLRRQGRTWDGVPVPRVGIRDLSRPAIDTFRKLARQSRRLDTAVLREKPQGLIEKLHLLDGKYLKRAAVLLFHADPEHFVTGAFVKIGYFRTNVDLLYHDEIHGDLFTQVSSTMDLLLTKYLKAGISYRGIQRVESLPVPEAALREAVLNAILHKDYSAGTPVQISVYDDRLMLWNPGELPQDWTVARLKAKHPSHPFNPGLANVFFRAGQIETWGRGIERIFSACTTAGTPPPALRCEQNGLWVDFEFGPAADISTREAEEKTGDKAREEPREKTREKILSLIRVNPGISMETMALSLGLTRKGVEWQIRNLKQAGILRRVGSRKRGHWEMLG
jgi:ATP-dependent DNA helicase RecG